MTNYLPISEARKNLPEIVDLAATLSQKTYITVKGNVKAAIVSARELELLEETLEILSDPKAMLAINKGKNQVKRNDLVDWDDLKLELGLE
jgi:antitoxin YefM